MDNDRHLEGVSLRCHRPAVNSPKLPGMAYCKNDMTQSSNQANVFGRTQDVVGAPLSYNLCRAPLVVERDLRTRGTMT